MNISDHAVCCFVHNIMYVCYVAGRCGGNEVFRHRHASLT
jgi:hypothetical protein